MESKNDSLDYTKDIEKLLKNTKIWKSIFTQITLQMMTYAVFAWLVSQPASNTVLLY